MFKPKKFAKSFKYAIEGLHLAVTLDQNVRIHIIIGVIVILAAFFMRASLFEFLFILFAIFFVLITEFINTAIEEMTNLITQEHRREARIAKDVAAAAVFLAALFALVVGIIIFVPKFLVLLGII